jgi:hypothetical protein
MLQKWCLEAQMATPSDVSHLRLVGSKRIRLDGARARMERSFLSRLRLYARELTEADLSDPDTFIALIQCAPDLRFPPGRVAELCGVPTQTVKAWMRGRDAPDSESQAFFLERLRAAVEERIRIAPDLSLPVQAASGKVSARGEELGSEDRVCSIPMNQTFTR